VLARSYLSDGDGLSPWRLISAFADEAQLVPLGRLCRAVHTLNVLLFPRFATPNRLFLNVHESLLHAVAEDHEVVDVARQTGLHRNTITLLYNETAARVDLDAIDKLCELFSVEVGALFEYFPDSRAVNK
jgi:putative transcriptional regulator